MPPNGSPLTEAWKEFDPETRLRLTVNELDRLYTRLDVMANRAASEHSTTRNEVTASIAAVKADFNERINILREEVRDGFEKLEKRQNRSIGLLYTMIGGIVVGLALLVVQLAPH